MSSKATKPSTCCGRSSSWCCRVVRCSLCEYDLRGQVDPRCPECGYQFNFDELRDPTRRLHPYLFEHHPEKNVRSFLRTFTASLRPRRFWAILFPTQALNRRRLIVYWLLATLAVLLTWSIFWGYCAQLNDFHNRGMRTSVSAGIDPEFKAKMIARFGTWQSYLDYEWPLLPNPRVAWQVFDHYQYAPMRMIPIVAISWPWLTLGALLLFQASLRRAQIRTIHVLRCILYSADAIVLAPIALLIWSCGENLYQPRGYFDVREFITLMLPALFVLLTYRLWIAYRTYLRFRHAFATVLASQVMVALLVLKVSLDFRWLGW